VKRRCPRKDLLLDLICHACGLRWTDRVGWKAKWVYCPTCNSREVHTYGPDRRAPDKFANGKVIRANFTPSAMPFLAVK
jgi:hypothetical protein